jgi:uncharacterized protein (DUF433 family)
MNHRITIDKEICHGKACIKGTRVPVYIILNLLASGESVENIMETYPHLTRADIHACIKYAAQLASEEVLIKT